MPYSVVTFYGTFDRELNFQIFFFVGTKQACRVCHMRRRIHACHVRVLQSANAVRCAETSVGTLVESALVGSANKGGLDKGP